MKSPLYSALSWLFVKYLPFNCCTGTMPITILLRIEIFTQKTTLSLFYVTEWPSVRLFHEWPQNHRLLVWRSFTLSSYFGGWKRGSGPAAGGAIDLVHDCTSLTVSGSGRLSVSGRSRANTPVTTARVENTMSGIQLAYLPCSTCAAIYHPNCVTFTQSCINLILQLVNFYCQLIGFWDTLAHTTLGRLYDHVWHMIIQSAQSRWRQQWNKFWKQNVQ